MQRRGPAGAIAENVAMDAKPRRVQDECGCSRRYTARTLCSADAKPLPLRSRPVAAVIGQWRSAAPLARPAIVRVVHAPLAVAAVTMELSAVTSPSTEATRLKS
jgi:hypothetical protein